MPMTDTFIELCEREFAAQVEREFETALQSGAREIPIVGGEFDPDGPPEVHVRLMGDAVRALLAKKWFEGEAPPWAQPLPLTFDDCVALFNGPNQGQRRPYLRGEYGVHVRSAGWDLRYVMPFEVFCASKLGSPG
jgi:hypothetical protein